MSKTCLVALEFPFKAFLLGSAFVRALGLSVRVSRVSSSERGSQPGGLGQRAAQQGHLFFLRIMRRCALA